MNIRRQDGLTLIGFIIMLSFTIFIIFIGMRIVPIYMEYYSVVSAMNGVASERGSANLSPFDIRVKMHNRLYVSYSSGNVKDRNMKITRNKGTHLRVAYEVRKPVIGNLDVVAKFDRTVQLAN